jgi:hypothetical protein
MSTAQTSPATRPSEPCPQSPNSSRRGACFPGKQNFTFTVAELMVLILKRDIQFSAKKTAQLQLKLTMAAEETSETS